jgi:phosphatidylserine/phosphatidylglycerophosphate/cardiolipin synthase-like enzyme
VSFRDLGVIVIQLAVYNNGDHAALAWLPADPQIAGCRGFAIQRSRGGEVQYLHGSVGFKEDEALPSDAPWKWPIQRYLWWDYGVAPGDVVKYRVIPVTGTAAELKERDELASEWSHELTITTQLTPHIAAYFNKGVVAAQWVSRALKQEDPEKTPKEGLLEIIKRVGDPLRDALGGLLKPELLAFLNESDASLYAALYELNDPELIAALKGLGAKANVILANGAFSPKEPDENKQVREDLNANSDVHLFDRLVSSGHFAHNKFAVVCNAAGEAQKVLTGSTNWTVSGLCSQANNGLVISDHDVADRFLKQWHALQQAGNGFPKELVEANSQQEQFDVDGIKVTPWFAPTRAQQDLGYARKLIAEAKQAAFFLFFNPGTYKEEPNQETLLQDVLERRGDGLYIRGVVNQEIAKVTEGADPPKHPVTLVGAAGETPLEKAVLVPANIAKKVGSFEPELRGASPVMVHSKVVVLDPFGEHPVLMTGSHNLGVKASSKNDDNLVILEGAAAAPLAIAYAVNIVAIFQEYRWNHYASQHPTDGWHGLEDDDTWQSGHLQGENLAELRFWTRAPAPPAAT